MNFRWTKATMPRPALAWIAIIISFIISVATLSLGVRYGFSSSDFKTSQGIARLPAILLAVAPIYVMAKSDAQSLSRQWGFRVFGIITALACIIYFV